MDVAECEETLFAVARVRLPSKIRVGEPGANGDMEPLGPRAKIEQLESYLLETAEARQRASEARLYMSAALRDLYRKYRDIEGWEGWLSEADRKKPSEKAKDEARRKVDTDLFESIQSAEWLVKRLSEEISRLQHDDDVVSRAYTFLTGG